MAFLSTSVDSGIPPVITLSLTLQERKKMGHAAPALMEGMSAADMQKEFTEKMEIHTPEMNRPRSKTEVGELLEPTDFHHSLKIGWCTVATVSASLGKK